MDIRQLFKRQHERNEQKQGNSKVPLIIDDDDDDDFKDSAISKKVGGVKRKTVVNSRKRTRQRLKDDSDSDTEASAKKSKFKLKATPTRSSPRKKSTTVLDNSKTSRTSKPLPGVSKTHKEQVTSIASFFGSAPIKRTTVKNQDSKKQVARVEKSESPLDDLFEIPESPSDTLPLAIDKEIARALQEEELKETKEQKVHDNKEFDNTTEELDRLEIFKTESVKPLRKKLKLMMERVPTRTSPAKHPPTTPTKINRPPPINIQGSICGPNTQGTRKEMSLKSPTLKKWSKKRIQYVDETDEDSINSIHSTPIKFSPTLTNSTHKTSTGISPANKSLSATPKLLFKSKVTSPITPKQEHQTPSSVNRSYKKNSTTPEPVTPVSASSNRGVDLPIDTPKPTRSESYKRYLNRSGPKAPGSKSIPEGQEGCLEGLTFVITGVLDSLERVDAENLIKKYGGKVTSSISGRTSYIVLGEDAGESKLAKADKLGTEKIDEDSLLELIKTKPAKKARKSHGPKKALAKLKSDTPPIPVDSFPIISKVKSSTVATSKVKEFYSSKQEGSNKSGHVTSVANDSMKTDEEMSLLWVDKYRPKSTKSIIGQSGDKSNAKKLSRWLLNWETNNLRVGGGKPLTGSQENGSMFKAALLSGPPGIGKTTTATLVCEEARYSYIELNASTNRNKSTLHGEVGAQVGSLSIDHFTGGAKGGGTDGRRHVLIMDEVDGMAGNQDRGGMQELIAMIRSSKIPIICICNDRQSTKVRSLANYCYDLRFQKPRAEQIKGAMMSVCFKEGIKIEPAALGEMIIASGQDVRQVLNNLSLWSVVDKPLSLDMTQESVRNAQKHSKKNPFDVVRTVFAPRDGDRELSLFEKSDLFFHDYNIAALFVQENYLLAKPAAAKGNNRATVKCIARAADSLCDGDLIEKQIRKSSRWELLPLQAFFSSVIPGEMMKGFLGKPEFPRWLGNNSKQSKRDRMLQDLQRHTRLVTSSNKTEFGIDYIPFLSAKLTRPLLDRGSEGIPDVVSTMKTYDLLKEDWDSIHELVHYHGHTDTLSQIPPKVKASFTRAYNKDKQLLHYNTAQAKKPIKRTAIDDPYNGTEEEDSTMLSEPDSNDEESTPAITVSKKKAVGAKKTKRSKVITNMGSKVKKPSKKGKITKKEKR